MNNKGEYAQELV